MPDSHTVNYDLIKWKCRDINKSPPGVTCNLPIRVFGILNGKEWVHGNVRIVIPKTSWHIHLEVW